MIQMRQDTAWLLAMAEKEDNCSVAVGGLPYTLSQLAAQAREQALERCALAKLVELQRRQLGLSVEDLAARADLALADVLAVERDAVVVLDSASASRLAAALSLPREKFLQLAGLAAAPRGRLKEESLRFTARSEPVTSLSREESQALEQFVKFLGEA